MGIVRFALRFPHTFYMVAALILFLGVVASREMPTDIFPEINIPVVTVIMRSANNFGANWAIAALTRRIAG
jgi:multidrug efflux pump subunit AcrB